MSVAGPEQLIIGSWQEPDNLNPYFTWAASGVWFGMLALESALRPDGRGGFAPVLVKHVPSLDNGDVADDGLTITYGLLEHLRWADGMPVTSEDLRFTWEVLRNPGNEIISPAGFDYVEAVDTPDELTAVLRLSRPFAPYPILYMSVFPKHAFGRQTCLNQEPFNAAPFGSGPYFVTEWRRTADIVYQRNPYYRGPGPHFERVRVRLFRSQDDLVAALKANEVHLAIGLGIHHLEALKTHQDLTVCAIPSTHMDRLLYNLQDPVLRDRRVRHAIDHAIDRRALVHDASGGMLQPARSELDGTEWFTPFPTRLPDPAKAGRLLDDAGWIRHTDGWRYRDGSLLSLSVCMPEGDNLRDRIVAALVKALKQVGIRLEPTRYPTSQYFAMVSGHGPLTEGRFQLAFSSSGMFGDPEINYTNQFHTSRIPSEHNNFVGGNWNGYSNPQVDQWLDTAAETLDSDRRKTLYAQVERAVHKDCPVSYLYKRPIIDAWTKTLRGVVHLPYLSVWCLTWGIQNWRHAHAAVGQ